MLRVAVLECSGPVAVRYPKGGDGAYQDEVWQDHLVPDARLTIVTYGSTIHDALAAAEMLNSSGIPTDLIKLDQIWPLSAGAAAASVRKTGALLVVEEAAEAGCIGTEIVAKLSSQGLFPSVRLLNLKDGIVPHGDLKTLRSLAGIDKEGIFRAGKELQHEE